MSALSKFFVVLVTIFSVAFVTLLVPFVTNTRTYRVEIEDLKRARAAAEVTAQLRQREIAALLDKESERVASMTAKVRSVEQKNIDLAARTSDAEAKAREAEAQRVQAEDRASTLAAANQNLSQLLTAQQATVATLQNSSLKDKTQIIELTDRNEELSSNIELLTQNVKYLKEDLVGMRSQYVALRKNWEKVPTLDRQRILGGGPDGPVTSAFKIQGKVTRIDQVDGQRFVQINLGSSDEVKKNMKFLVHRGDTYLGSLVITFVDEETAAGTLRAGVGVEVNAGDTVSTGE